MIKKNYNKMLMQYLKMCFKILKLMSNNKINKNKRWIKSLNNKKNRNKN